LFPNQGENNFKQSCFGYYLETLGLGRTVTDYFLKVFHRCRLAHGFSFRPSERARHRFQRNVATVHRPVKFALIAPIVFRFDFRDPERR